MARRPDTRSTPPTQGAEGLGRWLVGLLGGVLLVVLVVLVAVVVGGLDTGVDPPWGSSRSSVPRPAASAPESGSASTRESAGPTQSGALTALEQWDRRRSAAYATGSTARLRRLYVPGSRAGEADVALLDRYLDRGFRVRGMRTQVLALTVLGHRHGRWRVRVTDRLVGAVATGAGRRVRLPQGRAGGYVLTLVRDRVGGGDDREQSDDDRWRVSSARPARGPLS